MEKRAAEKAVKRGMVAAGKVISTRPSAAHSDKDSVTIVRTDIISDKAKRANEKRGKGRRSIRDVLKSRTSAHKRVEPLVAIDLYRATGFERVRLIREGVPAADLELIARKMDIPKERLYQTLSLHRSSVDRKIRNNDVLSPEQSERVIGLERLIGQAAVMVEQSGNPEGFDPDRWIGDWLERPNPALDGAKPVDFMDTMEGREIVSTLLAQSQSGAYA